MQRGTPQRIPMKQIKEVRVGDVAMASPPLKSLAADPKVSLDIFISIYTCNLGPLYCDLQAVEKLMAIVIVYGQGFALRFVLVLFFVYDFFNRLTFLITNLCRHLCIATDQAVEYLAWSRGLTLQIDRYSRMSVSLEAGSHHLQSLVKRHWMALVGKRPASLDVCGRL